MELQLQQGLSRIFSNSQLLQVIEISLNHNRDLRTATLNIQRAQQQYQIIKMTNYLPLVQQVALYDKLILL
jgi:multidrug efflux system outer membrane protein